MLKSRNIGVKYLNLRIINKTLNDRSSDQKRTFSKSFVQNSFFERNRRGIPPTYSDKPILEHVKQGRKIFMEECNKFVAETKEYFAQDRKFYKHGDTDIFFRFNSEDSLKMWKISSDKMNNEGFSDCNFIINDKGKGVFFGNIDTTPPKDGKNKFSGYCSIKSMRKMKSFLREDCYNFEPFTHLELRLKGDGRNYAINLGLGMYFDVNWFDTFSYTMFTHGGPYWQVIRIPFSKFILTSKGRVQDNQVQIPKSRVNSIGITSATVPGPFHLEIDYIGCHLDTNYKEEFAYELYQIPQEMVS